MSSASIRSNLENVSPLDGHENNEFDNVSTHECDSKSEEENKDSCRRKSRNKVYLNKMLHLLKEFLIMVVVAITYAAITNDPPKVGKSPAAYRFFSDDTYITDWYRGEISDAINQARSADIAFVMFYAPWDAESQHARKEFESVARYMHREVTFSAVNCWQPGSECKTQYNKVYKWPVLIAYPTHGRGIQYNGPLVAAYMMKFLKKIITPFERSKSYFDLLATYNVAIVGKVKAHPLSREYRVFYQTILRLIEKDPFQEIGVSVETLSYNDINSVDVPELYLYLWNETKIYPSDLQNWEVDSLYNWILKNIHQVTAWISPSGSKSMSLLSHLQSGPTLILFTPKNPLVFHNDYYSMLREIAHEYNGCGGGYISINVGKIFIRKKRRDRYLEQLRFIEECSVKKTRSLGLNSPNLWSNTSYCLEENYQSQSAFPSDNRMIHFYGGISALCVELLNKFENKDLSSKKKCKEDISNDIHHKVSKFDDSDDYRSPQKLQEHLKQETCRTFLIAQKYHPLVFSSELYNEQKIDFTGLKCKTNRSLNFISMDSLYYHHYAEKLGIDLSKKPNRTAAVILDDNMESHYIMGGAMNETNLKKFIYDFTRGSLNRALKSAETLVSKNTHTYSKTRLCSFEDAKFCILELSASNFLETISQSNKAVIIFYYSKQCSFCNGIANRFLTVAKYFEFMENFQFARIDGDLNLLPWEYTMEIYPTILFVPPNKVAESRVFPMDIPITVSNLIGFILANLQPSLKLEVMWAICEMKKLHSNVTECNASLRLQTSSMIDKILQEWRSSSNQEEKSVSLIKLQHFHNLYNLFIQESRNSTLVQNQLCSLKLIEMAPAESMVGIRI